MYYSDPLIWALSAVFFGIQAMAVTPQAPVVDDGRPVHHVKAIYLATNNSPNEVVALRVGKDGTVSDPTFTPTGGDGGIYIGPDGKDTPTDALASQDCIVRQGNVSNFCDTHVYFEY
jgi:hypothetical protein